MAPSVPPVALETEVATLALTMSASVVATLRLAIVVHLGQIVLVATETVPMGPFPTAVAVPVAMDVAEPRPIPYVGLPTRRIVPTLTVPTRAPAAVPATLEVRLLQTTTRPTTVVPVAATTPAVVPTAA